MFQLLRCCGSSPAGSSLSSLALQASDSLLSPLRSHLDNLLSTVSIACNRSNLRRKTHVVVEMSVMVCRKKERSFPSSKCQLCEVGARTLTG